MANLTENETPYEELTKGLAEVASILGQALSGLGETFVQASHIIAKSFIHQWDLIVQRFPEYAGHRRRTEMYYRRYERRGQAIKKRGGR